MTADTIRQTDFLILRMFTRKLLYTPHMRSTQFKLFTNVVGNGLLCSLVWQLCKCLFVDTEGVARRLVGG